MRVNRQRLARLQQRIADTQMERLMRSMTNEELLAALAELEEQAGVPPERRTRLVEREPYEAGSEEDRKGYSAR